MAKKNELSHRQKLLLTEAARRYLQFNDLNKDLDEAWVGLGTYTTYKTVYDAGLMVPTHGLTKGIIMWWVLTKKGAEIVKKLIDNAALTMINKMLDVSNDLSSQYQLFPVK